MFPRVAGPRRLAGISLVVLLLWTVVLWLLLPLNSPFVLFLQFTSSRFASLFRSPTDDERLLLGSPGAFPFADNEIAYIVKTGYGTQERVAALVEATKAIGAGTKYDDHNILVVADFAGNLDILGSKVVVHDVVEAVMKHDSVVQTPVKNVERIQKYGNMTLAITEGRIEEATRYSQAVGWELDALKFMPSLELAWELLPGKKWYVMQDDDTFILRPSLYRFLEHLDSSKDFYLGNAIGDYKGRFAHGGSGFILSQNAMSRLIDKNTEVLKQAYVSSLDETWGDKLVATTLMKVGVYLSERYAHFFNGESPLITKISADRICSPLVSFHGLANPDDMRQVGQVFANVDRPVFWRDLWALLGQPSLDSSDELYMNAGQDHVGRQNDPDMKTTVALAEQCRAACEKKGQGCLAWTWDQGTQECVMSPWLIVGDTVNGRTSGLNVGVVKSLNSHCGKAQI